MSAPEPNSEIGRVIASHGDEVGRTNDSPKEPLERERLDKLELLIEQQGKAGQLTTELGDYVTDLRGEIKSMWWIRLFSLGLGVVFMAIALWYLAYSVIYVSPTWTMVEGQYYRASAFIAVMAACVVVVSVILKGAFKTVAERHQLDIIPPHLKEIYEMYQATKP